MKPIKFERLPRVMQRTALCRSSLYLQIQQGLFPLGIKISARAVAWPSDEVDAVMAARLAGQNEQEIRSLVSRIIASRKDNQAKSHWEG